MNKSITDFIEDYIDGEPLTTDTIAYAIKKYLYINFTPTKQQRLEMYEAFLWALANSVTFKENEHTDSLIKNVCSWAAAKVNNSKSSEDQTSLENETFYNLTKVE